MRDHPGLEGQSNPFYPDLGLLGDVQSLWPELLRLFERESVKADMFLYEGETVSYENVTSTNINSILDKFRVFHETHKLYLRMATIHTAAITISFVRIRR